MGFMHQALKFLAWLLRLYTGLFSIASTAVHLRQLLVDHRQSQTQSARSGPVRRAGVRADVEAGHLHCHEHLKISHILLEHDGPGLNRDQRLHSSHPSQESAFRSL